MYIAICVLYQSQSDLSYQEFLLFNLNRFASPPHATSTYSSQIIQCTYRTWNSTTSAATGSIASSLTPYLIAMFTIVHDQIIMLYLVHHHPFAFTIIKVLTSTKKQSSIVTSAIPVAKRRTNKPRSFRWPQRAFHARPRGSLYFTDVVHSGRHRSSDAEGVRRCLTDAEGTEPCSQC